MGNFRSYSNSSVNLHLLKCEICAVFGFSFKLGDSSNGSVSSNPKIRVSIFLLPFFILEAINVNHCAY